MKSAEKSSRRAGLLGAWALLALLLLLIVVRGFLVREATGWLAVECTTCMGATAMQQDASLFAIALALTGLAFLTRHYLIQLPLLLIEIVLVAAYAIDMVVTKTLSQRLYLFDVFKFGKEIGAISELGHIFAESSAGKLALIIAVVGLVAVIAALAPRPRRPRLALACFAACAAFGLLGSWQPVTLNYVHSELLQNLVTVNLEQSLDKPYSPAFIENLKRTYTPLQPVCAAGQNLHPNIIVVAVESLSMRQSALFGGGDSTPNLDSLAKRYTWFPNFFANGHSTDGALIALLTQRAPVPAIGQYESTDAFAGFDKPDGAIPTLLHQAHYTAHFFTTGDLSFLDKPAWFKALGFDSWEGAENPFYSGWKRRHFGAAEDKALYQRFLQWMDQREDPAPWFSLLLTVSTHPPFVNPQTEQLDELGAFRYADLQIGMLAGELEKRGFFDNGVLIVMGDHRSMTPLLQSEQARFGDSVMARVPMVVATNLPIAHGEVDAQFQQTDLAASVADLVTPQACHTAAQGLFLREQPLPPDYIVHARGDRRSLAEIYFDHQHGEVVLDGDNSRWEGSKPANWQQIMDGIAADRISRGAKQDNLIDAIMRLRYGLDQKQAD